MKKIDKIIISMLSIAATVFGVYFIIFHFFLTLKAIAVVIGIGYLLFLGMHMALLLPLFLIIISVSDFIRFNKLFESIKNASEIIYEAILVLCQMIAISFTYLGVPILIAFMFNGNVNVNEALKTINHFL